MKDLELLRLVATLDVRMARLVRDMANQRLRDPGATTPSPWHQPTAHLPAPSRYDKCKSCGVLRDIHGLVTDHDFVSEGVELQRGLEAAVEFERSQVGRAGQA